MNIFPFKDDQYVKKHSKNSEGEWFWGFDEEFEIYFKGNINDLVFEDWTKFGTVLIPLDGEDIFIINELKNQFMLYSQTEVDSKKDNKEKLVLLLENMLRDICSKDKKQEETQKKQDKDKLFDSLENGFPISIDMIYNSYNDNNQYKINFKYDKTREYELLKSSKNDYIIKDKYNFH